MDGGRSRQENSGRKRRKGRKIIRKKKTENNGRDVPLEGTQGRRVKWSLGIQEGLSEMVTAKLGPGCQRSAPADIQRESFLGRGPHTRP